MWVSHRSEALRAPRRALAVKNILLREDAPNPPRVTQREYRLGQPQINQSVTLVLYESSPAASVAAR